VREFGDKYRAPTQAAADWLVETQDDDGCWRKNSVPFVMPGEKAYETHLAWGLLETAPFGAGCHLRRSGLAQQ